MQNQHFWHNKKVLITGHTGFKGSWLSLWLHTLGANITGYALAPATTPNLYTLCNVKDFTHSVIDDIRNYDRICQVVHDFQPEVIFHLAAQPLVLTSYEDPITTYQTNVIGTLHLFEAIRKCSQAKVIVNITSDKCYENKEWPWAYRETEALGGHDPYSSSKGCAEILTSSYRSSYFDADNSTALASARAGNCIGGGDWTHNRLIPNLMHSYFAKETLEVRSPQATRPWQHVLEPLQGYILLAEKLWQDRKQFASAWNFGPTDQDVKPVAWVVKKMADLFPNSLHYQLATSNAEQHEAQLLRVDSSKARALLGWQSLLSLETALTWTADWYNHFEQNQDMQAYTALQIQQYRQLLMQSGQDQ